MIIKVVLCTIFIETDTYFRRLLYIITNQWHIKTSYLVKLKNKTCQNIKNALLPEGQMHQNHSVYFHFFSATVFFKQYLRGKLNLTDLLQNIPRGESETSLCASLFIKT